MHSSTLIKDLSARGQKPVPQAISERIKKLREEIAGIQAVSRVRSQPLEGSMQSQKERRIQRLQEIIGELNSLTDWKKL
jgi:hypothetical protein